MPAAKVDQKLREHHTSHVVITGVPTLRRVICRQVVIRSAYSRKSTVGIVVARIADAVVGTSQILCGAKQLRSQVGSRLADLLLRRTGVVRGFLESRVILQSDLNCLLER